MVTYFLLGIYNSIFFNTDLIVAPFQLSDLHINKSLKMPKSLLNKRDCFICQKVVILDANSSFKDHQTKEHFDIIKNAKKSSSTKEAVESACKICGSHIKVTAMRNHTKAAHKMTITEYKEKYSQKEYYDLVEIVLHECGICGEYLLLDSDYVAKHLKSYGNAKTHNITHYNYNAQYMKLKGVSWKQKQENKLTTEGAIPTKKIDTFESAVQQQNEESSLDNIKMTFKNISSDYEQSLMNNTKTQVSLKINEDEDEDEDDNNDDDDDDVGGDGYVYANHDGITVDGFNALLDMIADDGEELRYPILEALLRLDI